MPVCGVGDQAGPAPQTPAGRRRAALAATRRRERRLSGIEGDLMSNPLIENALAIIGDVQSGVLAEDEAAGRLEAGLAGQEKRKEAA
jgi:hypothetical protein